MEYAPCILFLLQRFFKLSQNSNQKKKEKKKPQQPSEFFPPSNHPSDDLRLNNEYNMACTRKREIDTSAFSLIESLLRYGAYSAKLEESSHKRVKQPLDNFSPTRLPFGVIGAHTPNNPITESSVASAFALTLPELRSNEDAFPEGLYPKALERARKFFSSLRSKI